MNAKTEKRIQDDIAKLKLSSIEEILEILGFIDGKGQTRLDGKPGSTTYDAIQSFLLSRDPNETKQDFSRRIKTAIRFQKSLSKEVSITSSKTGFFVEPPNNWKKKLSYSSLCLLYLGIMAQRDEVSMDILDQLLEMKSPLLQIILWRRLIQNQRPVQFEYTSDRRKEIDFYKCFLPVRLHHRDGHWKLIGWDNTNQVYRSIPLHSIDNVTDSLEPLSGDIPEFSMDRFRKNLFGAGFDPKEKPVTAKISVAKEYQSAVRKRKPLGVWIQTPKGKSDIWEITAYYPDEIFDYVFRWNGIIQIVSPESMVDGFREKCSKFLRKK